MTSFAAANTGDGPSLTGMLLEAPGTDPLLTYYYFHWK